MKKLKAERRSGGIYVDNVKFLILTNAASEDYAKNRQTSHEINAARWGAVAELLHREEVERKAAERAAERKFEKQCEAAYSAVHPEPFPRWGKANEALKAHWRKAIRAALDLEKNYDPEEDFDDPEEDFDDYDY